MSIRSSVPEITAAEAEEVNKRLPDFNNNMSRVYEIQNYESAPDHVEQPAPPFTADTDWTGPDVPCGHQAK
jgi:hypothetical protein